MEKKFSRPKRVAQEIKKKISVIIQQEIQDPRINLMTTVSDVTISKDLTYAKVFLTFLNHKDKKKIDNNIAALQNMSGYIRYLIGKKMYLRVIPKIIFIYDSSLVDGIKMSNLIAKIMKDDKQLQIKTEIVK